MDATPPNTALSGPGSQPAESDGAELAYFSMPDSMATYIPPQLPESDQIAQTPEAIALLKSLHRACAEFRVGRPGLAFCLDRLDATNRELLDQVLGEGEVSILFDKGDHQARLQETRLAGVWRCHESRDAGETGSNYIELATIPEVIRRRTFIGAATNMDLENEQLPADIMNAAPLLTELNGQIARPPHPGQAAHVINLSLLPFTPEDHSFVESRLGKGPSTILSRGYGNCRITATATASVWWVQYYNSTDTCILNTLEVAEVPQVACAAQEDLEDSAERLAEILETIGQ